MICGDKQEIGEKAYNLRCLQENQICIPGTTVIPNDMCAYIDGLKKNGSEISEINAILEEKNFFGFEKKLNYPFIIRSSSIDEDNEKKSNAGKYMSIYNCTSRMDLINDIIKCWNSKNSNESMGVIIQEQLFPYCSGVAFISDDNGERRLFVEGVIGLGELLVSGYVTPSTYLYDYAKDDFTLIHKTTQRVAEFPLKDNTIAPTDEFCVGEHPFRVMNLRRNVCYALCDYMHDYWAHSQEILGMLKEECFKIYDSFGASDIEWVYGENGKMYIVQRRPITRAVNFNINSVVDNNTRKNNGTTIVSGKAVGKLVSLSEYNGEDDVIVFATMFLPRDIIRVSNARGIISIECSLLSHCSILAREYGIPYWAGVDMSLYEKNKGCMVDIDFDKKEIKMPDTTKQELKPKTIGEPFKMNIFDPITLYCIPEAEKEKYTISITIKKMISKYYDAEFLERVWGDV